MVALVIFIILFILLIGGTSKKSRPNIGGAMVGTGRSPVYLDIMEEEMAPLKVKLQEDAKNGVIYKKRKLSFEQLKNGEHGEEYEQSAEDALKEFEAWESNGYM